MTTLIVLWSILTAAFAALLIYRAHLTRQETDQLFLNDATEHTHEIEQEVLIGKVSRIRPFVQTAGGAFVVMSLLVAGTYVVQVLPNVRF
jgi:Fe2+ transport system protein B